MTHTPDVGGTNDVGWYMAESWGVWGFFAAALGGIVFILMLAAGFSDPRAWTFAFTLCLPVTILGVVAMLMAHYLPGRGGRGAPAHPKR